jgi:exonuclease VII small subunit
VPGFLSKKMKIQSLEKHLEALKSQEADLEEYIRELKAE